MNALQRDKCFGRRMIASHTAAADAAHRHSHSGDPPYLARGGVSAPRIHSGPCHCGDDAQRHYALIARDLMQQGRESELTDDMRQAYDYEFGGVVEPAPPSLF